MSPVIRLFAAVCAIAVFAAGGAATPGLAKGPGMNGHAPHPVPTVGPTYNWANLDSLLVRYVKDGLVDYPAWKAAGSADLDKLLADAAAWADYDSAHADEKIVFLTNAYNAFVLSDVIEKYPVKGIKDIPGVFDTKKHAIAGGHYTLDEIEKKLIKPIATDPWYHFALVCGSMGCPQLRSRAYRTATWGGDTANQAQHFLADPTKFVFDEKVNVIHVSEMFKWYRSQFEYGDTTLPRWIGPNLSLGAAMKMSSDEPMVEFLPFDWSLNDGSRGAK